LAATIGFTEVVTKSLLYYLHERAWLRIPYGRRHPTRTASGERAGPPTDGARYS
jgi:uncharacterized membrane protein